jgi:putative endonuclease
MTEGEVRSKRWFVYILKCSDGTLYCGVTTDLERRVNEHNNGTASRYTRSRRPVTLKGFAVFPDRGTAQRAEHAVKKKPPGEKLGFLEGLVED